VGRLEGKWSCVSDPLPQRLAVLVVVVVVMVLLSVARGIA